MNLATYSHMVAEPTLRGLIDKMSYYASIIIPEKDTQIRFISFTNEFEYLERLSGRFDLRFFQPHGLVYGFEEDEDTLLNILAHIASHLSPNFTSGELQEAAWTVLFHHDKNIKYMMTK